MRTETEALLGKLQLAGAQRAETHTKVLYLLTCCTYSLLTTHYSLLATHYPLLTTRYSLLATHYLLQVLKHWEGELHAFVEAGVGARLELVQMEGNARTFLTLALSLALSLSLSLSLSLTLTLTR